MGLDALELVMAVEEKFGVVISDNEAETVRTVGDLYELLLSECRETPVGNCRTAAAFYHVRRALCEVTGEPPRQVRPATPIEPATYRRLRRRVNCRAGFDLPQFAWRLKTVGDLAKTVADRNQAWFHARQISWRSEQIWTELLSTIAEVLCVDAKLLTPRTRFIEDLNI